MISKLSLIPLSLCTAFVVTGPAKQLQADDESQKVVCSGDSITKRDYPDLLGNLLHVKAINAGVAGNTSREGLRRVKKDALAHHPDVVVLFFGINDIRVDAPKKHVELNEYKSNLEKIINTCRMQKAKVVLCTLPSIESKAYFTRHEQKLLDDHGGLEQLIKIYRDTARKVAQHCEVPLVDFNQLLEKDPAWLSKDGVQPSKEGSQISQNRQLKSCAVAGGRCQSNRIKKDAEFYDGKTEQITIKVLFILTLPLR